ncbi:HTH-type transcriptional regulator [Bacillus sp. OxB-1]|nr:HTH-type transcriptional regulator [Bacillus sp. OxB-1]
MIKLDNLIKEKRVERGWTQDELAEKVDVSRQTVISLEKGRYNPSLLLAFKIAKLFECSIEDIFIPEEE